MLVGEHPRVLPLQVAPLWAPRLWCQSFQWPPIGARRPVMETEDVITSFYQKATKHPSKGEITSKKSSKWIPNSLRKSEIYQSEHVHVLIFLDPLLTGFSNKHPPKFPSFFETSSVFLRKNSWLPGRPFLFGTAPLG